MSPKRFKVANFKRTKQELCYGFFARPDMLESNPKSTNTFYALLLFTFSNRIPKRLVGDQSGFLTKQPAYSWVFGSWDQFCVRRFCICMKRFPDTRRYSRIWRSLGRSRMSCSTSSTSAAGRARIECLQWPLKPFCAASHSAVTMSYR